MALQFSLKQPKNHSPESKQPTKTKQMITESEIHLKQLKLKYSSFHSQKINCHQNRGHPYHHQMLLTSPHTQLHTFTSDSQPYGSKTLNKSHLLHMYALNHKSSFSAASCSTGEGTSSSCAPTHQSGSSVSSHEVSINTCTETAGNKNESTKRTIVGSNTRTNVLNGTKKLKPEPLLLQCHQSERLNFANVYFIWNEEQWKRVIFQDERRFNLDGPDGFSYYFHDLRNYERNLSQRPHGNSVYVYIAFAFSGPVHLDVSIARQQPATCIEAIIRQCSNITTKLGSNTDIMLQDFNYLETSAQSIHDWLSVQGIKIQKWPSISHDINIVENIWGWIIREVYDGGRKFKRKDDLIFRIREVWSQLPLDLVSNLYHTLPERISELYHTRGMYTNC